MTATTPTRKPPVILACPECGRTFTRTHPHQRYCREACYEAFNDRQEGVRRRAEREKQKAQQRAERPPPPKPKLICVVCGVEFEHPRTCRRYCTEFCSRVARRKRQLEQARQAKEREQQRLCPNPPEPASVVQSAQKLYEVQRYPLRYLPPHNAVRRVWEAVLAYRTPQERGLMQEEARAGCQHRGEEVRQCARCKTRWCAACKASVHERCPKA